MATNTFCFIAASGIIVDKLGPYLGISHHVADKTLNLCVYIFTVQMGAETTTTILITLLKLLF